MKKLGFIGAGNMGEALIRGLLEKKVFKATEIIAADPEPKRRQKLARTLGIETTTKNPEVIVNAPAIVVAVKPQIIDTVLEDAKRALEQTSQAQAGRSVSARSSAKSKPKAGRLFISIAAGITLNHLEGQLGSLARVVRVMPNAPAMVGRGMAAVVRGARASTADEALTLKIFGAVGEAVAIKDEAALDGVTALSGSGPAYVYLFAKALADAAASEGIEPRLALKMTLQTLLGAVAMMRESGLGPDELIRMVASPGGTTEAALSAFSQQGFTTVVAGAVRAAAARSRELGRIR
jgi:pyrroline-5-carboxylate reductase